MGRGVILRRRTGLHDGVQGIWVYTHRGKAGPVEEDPGIGEEALSDHPAERDTCETVTGFVADGAAADV